MSNLLVNVNVSSRSNLVLQAFPGQLVSIVFETVDGYGQRADGYHIPSIASILNPSLVSAVGYPQDMVKIATGLYVFRFTLPAGAAAVGTYIVNIDYYDPDDPIEKNIFYLVLVNAPFGQYSVSTG